LYKAWQSVCCDLWEAYTEAVRERLLTPELGRSFHVAKHYRLAADQVRKQEFQYLKKELPKEDDENSMTVFEPFGKMPTT